MSNKIDKSNVVAVLELSMIQQAMLFHYLREKDRAIYNVQLALQLDGPLNVSVLQLALQQVQAHNDALRSVFRWEAVHKPVQIVLKQIPLHFSYVNLDLEEGEDEASRLSAYLQQDQATRFDLTELALRYHCLKLRDNQHILILTHHHILYDGWSTGILLKELFAAYHQLLQHKSVQSVTKPALVSMQMALQQGIQVAQQNHYWAQYLQTYEPKTLFNPTQSNFTALNKYCFTASLTALDALAVTHQVTRAAIIYTAYGLLLRKYFNNDDVVFGTVVSTREVELAGADAVMGNFINTLPLRLQPGNDLSLIQAVQATQAALLERMPHVHSSYAEIKALLTLGPDEQLFDTAVVIENYPLDPAIRRENQDLSIKLHAVQEDTDIPLLLTGYFNAVLELEFTCHASLSTQLDLASFGQQLLQVLHQLGHEPNLKLTALDILLEADRQQLSETFNNTTCPYPLESNMMALFEAQVLRSPQQKALQYGDFALTYRELDDYAGRIAGYLKRVKGAEPGTLVGVMLEREELLIPAIYGILKAGCTYIPIDPHAPTHRLEQILEDSGLDLIFSRNRYIPVNLAFSGWIDLDKIEPRLSAQTPFRASIDPHSLAYIIYTSGSTGRPKGVMIEHHSVVNRLLWMQKQYPVSTEDVFVQKTPTVFDVSVWELFWWSFAGASLYVLPPGAEKDSLLLVEAIKTQQVTVIHFVPSMLGSFLNNLEAGDSASLATLRYVFASGEALQTAHVATFAAKLYAPNASRLINLYGPTEATVDVSYYECDFKAALPNTIPIGKPIDNIRLYILDRWGFSVPTGVPGELCIAGVGLARGYLNQLELSKEKFVDQPAVIGERLYKTGDLAKWDQDGNIVFMGRLDNQVKLRGLRIELGEVEYQLGQIAGIRDAVVVLKQIREEPYLVAYYLSDQVKDQGDLKSSLAARLPEYMVPGFFVQLEQWPLSSNGKLDRKALPLPLSAGPAEEQEAPSNALEEQLVQIWSNLLKINAQHIGVNRSFFELGGHSLKAINLIAELYRAFKIRIALTDVFQLLTIKALAEHIRGQHALHLPEIQPTEFATAYPLSPVQERLYFAYLFDARATIYNGGVVLVLQGAIDAQKIEHAFQLLIQRHEILRTAFMMEGNEPMQVVLEDVPFKLEPLIFDQPLNHQLLYHHFVKAFDLSRPPLIRAGLAHLASDQAILIIDIHHIVNDGLSQEVLIRDFTALYQQQELPPLALHYKDYAVWCRQQAQSENQLKQKRHWEEVFAQLPPALVLPYDAERPAVNHHPAARNFFEIDAQLTAGLQKVAAQEGVTLYTLLLAIFKVLLAKFSNQDDIVVGTPVSGRDILGLEGMLGMFVNTLPLRNQVRGDQSFQTFLQQVKSNTLAALSNQSYAYGDMVAMLPLERDQSRNPLFDVLFAYQDYKAAQLQIPGVSIEVIEPGHHSTEFDLILSVSNQHQGKLSAHFEFAQDLFQEETIARMTACFLNLIRALIANTSLTIANIDYLPQPERQQLIEEFNATQLNLPAHASIYSLFYQQVQQTPHRLALLHGNHTLTYTALHHKVQTIAAQLRPHIKVGKDRIALLFDPSIEMSVAILAVIYAGGTYVPLSPDAPLERNLFILQDSGAKLLLTDTASLEGEGAALEAAMEETIRVDGVSTSSAPLEKMEIPHPIVYIVYTSGTSGQPKGVAIRHESLLNYAWWSISAHGLTPTDRALQLVSYYFDGFGANFYPILLAGGSMVSVPKAERLNPDYLAELVHSKGITHFATLPGLYAEMLSALIPTQAQALRFVVLAGERASAALVHKSKTQLPAVQLKNEYGPTETTIAATHNHHLQPEANAVIGKPIGNTAVWILDKYAGILPRGVKGELCIAGRGLSAGYLNNDQLSNEKFRINPLRQGEKLYKTGDLARWLPTGELEIFSRIDDQIKIRGFRVEPAEIEKYLVAYPSINEAIILPWEQRQSVVLVAYYTGDQKLANAELRAWLGTRLPDYMIPALFVYLSALPYTPIGKVDKKALPHPIFETESDQVAQTAEELLLSDTWKAVLGLEQIGVNDNFFALGGDSIKSIQVCSKMRAAGYELKVRDIFTAPTIKALALRLKRGNAWSELPEAVEKATLSPIQNWFLNGPIQNKNHFNQTLLLAVSTDISLAQIHAALEKMVQHHDMLRAAFFKTGEEWVQEIKTHVVPITLETYDLRGQGEVKQTILELGNQLQRSLNIETGRVFQSGFFQTDAGAYLLIVVHHLVVDGISWRILLEDLNTLWTQMYHEAPLALPSKATSYLNWPTQLAKYTETHTFDKNKTYWQNLLQVHTPKLELDFPQGRNTIADVQTFEVKLNEVQTKQLLQQASATYGTQPIELLLAAFALTVKEQYELNEIKVDLEGHGRHEAFDGDFNRTLGWFTSIYPVVFDLQDADLELGIIQAKETLRQVPLQGADFLLQHYAEQPIHPRSADIAFNYLGQFDTDASSKFFSFTETLPFETIASTEERIYLWELTGILVNAQLQLTLAYSGQQFSDTRIKSFMQGYQRNLLAIIDHCLARKEKVLTPADFTFRGLSLAQVRSLPQLHLIEDVCTLSPMQEGLLFHALLAPESADYFEQTTLHLTGHLEVEAVKQTMEALCNRHSILRTLFLHKDLERPLQIVLTHREIDVTYTDIRGLPGTVAQTIQALQVADRQQKFDLSKDTLLRLQLIQTGTETYVLLLSHHHILMDGWCMGIILEEFKKLYAQQIEGTAADLSPAYPYSHYIDWLEKRDQTGSLEFWANYLQDYATPSGLPQKEAQLSARQMRSKSFTLDRTHSEKLQAVAQEHAVTLNHICQLAWGILLAHYSQQEDCLFGTVVAGRPPELEGSEHILGLFMNTLPIRLNWAAAETLGSVLQRIRDAAIAMEEHQYVSLPDIQSFSVLGNALFDHLFIFENYPLSAALIRDREAGFQIDQVDFFDQTHYDLSIVIVPGAEIQWKFNFNAMCYEEALITQILTQLQHILDQLGHQNIQQISDITLLEEHTRSHLLYTLNDSQHDWHEVENLLPLFDQQVLAYPHRVAITDGSHDLTYAQLNAQANQVAGYLRTKFEVRAGDLIGVLLQRELRLVPTLLGILKTGAAFVPMDTGYPANRLEGIVADANLKLLISRSAYLTPSLQALTSILDWDAGAEEIEATSSTPVEFTPATDSLAYVIYTSGSTGKPKGVMIEHRSLYNYLRWAQEMYVEEVPATFALYSSIAFDLTITSIFTPLIGGHKIVLYEQEEGNLLLNRVMQDNQVSVLKLTPSHLKIIRDSYLAGDLKAQKLRTLIVGGEDLETALAQQIYTLFEGRLAIYNEYGPTEATVGCMIYRFNPDDPYPAVPIGVPAYNTQIYLLDKYLQVVPFGVMGELYIAGKGLARGYLYNETLTESRFVANPFAVGHKMYKTGDLALRTHDGKTLFKGRVDEQVKLRGFRIELREVESHMAAIDGVKETCVVLQNTQGEQYLVAYWVPGEDAPTPTQLKEVLATRLPDYMVPPHFVMVDQFPLTPNGKIDRKALPVFELSVKGEKVKPATLDEAKMAHIWADLLKIEPDDIGVNDHFFALGGHSLKAIALVNRIRKEWGIDIQLKAIFQHPELRSLVKLLPTSAATASLSILPATTQSYYVLSAAQKRMYVLYQLNQDSLAYNMPNAFRLSGIVDADKLEAAFNQLVQRHEILRTVFREPSLGAPVQIIQEAAPFKIARMEAQGGDGRAEMAQFVQPFRLEAGPLVRIGLICLTPTEHLLLVDMHHIITDGISQELMIADFLAFYQNETLPPLELQYKDYATWQQSPQQQQTWQTQREYWLAQFTDEIPVLNLPTDFSRPSNKDYAGDALVFELDEAESKALKQRAEEEESTIFVILLAAWSILLSKLSGQEDIVTGTPTSGRSHSDVEKMLGMFVNTLALRCTPKGNLSIREYVQQLHDSTITHFDNQLYQYENLVNDLKLERDASRNPLFDVMFVLQNFEVNSFGLPGLQIEPHPTEHTISKFDLLLSGGERDGRFSFKLEYATALFAHHTIARFIDYFRNILSAICTHPSQKIAAIDWIPGLEKQQVISGFNETTIPYPSNGNIIELFEAQVAKMPHQKAVQFGDFALSYQALDDWSGQFAFYLVHECRAQVGDLIGVMLEREEYLIPAIYGILKAGCAYVPIDPHFPVERIQSILGDSGIKRVITRKRHVSAQITFDHWLDLDLLLPTIEQQEKCTIPLKGNDLAYVIYTSGSTGKPKGVMIEHHSIVNRLLWMQKNYPVAAEDVFLQKTPLVFDVSVWELFWWSFTGASLSVLPPGGEKDVALMLGLIEKQGISVMHFVPSMLNYFLAEVQKETSLTRFYKLRMVFASGEALQAAHVEQFGRSLWRWNQTRLINLYGPTEATVDVSYYECDFSQPIPAFIPIGKPIDNTRFYITDQWGNPLPIGLAGELAIAGVGLARGYLNNEKLTQEKFVHPTSGIQERIYKTGDLAKWAPDGNVIFLGRIDNQVKLRGLRIELGEIEYQLQTHEQIKDAVVLLKHRQGEPHLIAYYVSMASMSSEHLRTHLAKSLPEYMIPPYFVHLSAFPLSINGKLDRKALPEPQFNTTGNQLMPTSTTEWQVLALWAEVLKIDVAQIGTTRNFFELGGHSLAALHLINLINKEFAIVMSLREMFAQDTIVKMARWIEEKEKTGASVIPKVAPQQLYPASPAQERLYYLQMLDKGSLAYNISGVFELKTKLSASDLTRAFEQLIARHEILRTNFVLSEERLWQRVEPNISFGLKVAEQQPEESIVNTFNHFIQPFDLSVDILFRSLVLKANDGREYLFFDIHHIICDGLSLNILMQDFRNICQNLVLPEAGTRYLDYAAWQQTNHENLAKQKTYWQQKLNGVLYPLDLPVLNPRQEVTINRAAVHHLVIKKDDYEEIRQVLQKTQATPFMFLLSVYYLLLSKVSGQTDLIIGTDAAGRTHHTLKNTIGTFVNLLPLRIQLPADSTFDAFLQSVKALVIEGFDHQDFQFDQMLDLLKWDSQVQGHPLVQVHFAFANFIEPWEKWPDADLIPLKIERDFTTQYEFKIEARVEQQQFHLAFVYSTDLYSASFICLLAEYYLNIVHTVVKDPHTLLEDIEIEASVGAM